MPIFLKSYIPLRFELIGGNQSFFSFVSTPLPFDTSVFHKRCIPSEFIIYFWMHFVLPVVFESTISFFDFSSLNFIRAYYLCAKNRKFQLCESTTSQLYFMSILLSLPLLSICVSVACRCCYFSRRLRHLLSFACIVLSYAQTNASCIAQSNKTVFMWYDSSRS